MGVLCDSWCFCKKETRSDRIRSSIFSSMSPYMAAISVSHSINLLAGTGFIIDRNLLLTTHAILPSTSSAMASKIRLHNGDSVHLLPQRFFITSSVLDLTIVSLETAISNSDSFRQSKACSKSSLDLGSKVYFLGHHKRELTVGEGKVVISTDNLLKLSTDEKTWSAGTAGFDQHGHLAFMICDPMKLATSSNTSSSSSSKDEPTQFGIPIVIIRDWLNRHWNGNLTKPMRSMSLDHSCASFSLARKEAGSTSLLEQQGNSKTEKDEVNSTEKKADEASEEVIRGDTSEVEASSTGSVNGGIARNEIECSSSAPEVREQWSSEEETMYSAETAESRNYSIPPPRNSKFPPLARSGSCSTFSKPGSVPGSGRGSGRTVGNLRRCNDYFTPTVSSTMKRNGSEQGGRPPRWKP